MSGFNTWILVVPIIASLAYIRSEFVYHGRTRWIAKAIRLTQEAINNKDAGHQKYWREFQKVSYHKMIWQFWRSIDSFYRGTLLDTNPYREGPK